MVRYFPMNLSEWERIVAEASRGTSLMNYPPHEIRDTEKGYVIEFALAGWKREDISIKTEQNVLSITGNASEREKEGNVIKSTIAYRSFELHKKLPEICDADGITATMNEGILSIMIPFDQKKIAKKEIEIM